VNSMVSTRMLQIARTCWLLSNHAFSSLRLKMMGCKNTGRRTYMGRRVKIRNAPSISLGDDVYLGAQSQIISEGGTSFIRIGSNTDILFGSMLLTQAGWIAIGSNCSVNPYSILYGYGGLRIGDGVRIAAHTVIIPQQHTFGVADTPIYLQGFTGKGVTIEDDVWIGANCTILDGVTIGKGSVIGAGSVVTRDVPPYSVAVGAPARAIRRRGSAPSREARANE
jgi:acetyltransferase-like isoleucine patch superfamily enzyme